MAYVLWILGGSALGAFIAIIASYLDHRKRNKSMWDSGFTYVVILLGLIAGGLIGFMGATAIEVSKMSPL